MKIPPVIFFMIAAALLVFGPLRAYYFGLKHRVPPDEETPEERKRRRRHVMWGGLWFLFGAYIVYLGVMVQRSETVVDVRSPDSGPTRVNIGGE